MIALTDLEIPALNGMVSMPLEEFILKTLKENK